MNGKELCKILFASIVIPVAVQVGSQLALMWVDHLLKNSKVRVEIR
jgi:hypothetical protein